MQEKANWPFIPTEVSLKIFSGPGETVSKAEMRVKTIKGEDLIVLHGPKLISSSHSDLNELAANLADVTEVMCYREPWEGIVKCRVDISREDNAFESIWCEDIDGLPE